MEQFNCIGQYAEAETKDAFRNVLKNVISKAVLNTTVQVNLNDINLQPNETNVTMLFYQAGTKKLLYTYVHTINKAGNPDTINIDPQYKYDLVVNTIPKVEKKDIEIFRNSHNIIPVDCPQGFIRMRFSNASRPYLVETRISQKEDGRTINVQQINTTDKYIVGNYFLEILTLPRTYRELKVDQSTTTTINVEAPGLFTHRSGTKVIAQVFVINDDKTLGWVCNLDESARSGQYYLQPGNYRVVYRNKDMKSAANTIEKDFRIYSNKTTSVNL